MAGISAVTVLPIIHVVTDWMSVLGTLLSRVAQLVRMVFGI